MPEIIHVPDVYLNIPWRRLIPSFIHSSLTPSSGPIQEISQEDAKTFFNFSDINRRLVLITLAIVFVIGNSLLFRLAMVISRERAAKGRPRPDGAGGNPTHLLVVLGSGGHTAEMLNMLRQIPDLANTYTYRTYVVSSGDDFSALKASEFEKELDSAEGKENVNYDITTITRARRIHQPLYTTLPTALSCLWDCLAVLRGKHADQHCKSPTYPDLILTNGPGTGVCVVLASIILLFFGFRGRRSAAVEGKSYSEAGEMRTIFIESWARVKTLSLSGKILKALVDRFLVQWPETAEDDAKVECTGALVA